MSIRSADCMLKRHEDGQCVAYASHGARVAAMHCVYRAGARNGVQELSVHGWDHPPDRVCAMRQLPNGVCSHQANSPTLCIGRLHRKRSTPYRSPSDCKTVTSLSCPNDQTVGSQRHGCGCTWTPQTRTDLLHVVETSRMVKFSTPPRRHQRAPPSRCTCASPTSLTSQREDFRIAETAPLCRCVISTP